MWEANAAAWVELSRAGYDVYRDLVNTPSFLAMLPDVAGLVGIDLGCGEGHNTRLVRDRGARVVGIDISPTFVRAARSEEPETSGQIRYLLASGLEVPVRDASVDVSVAVAAPARSTRSSATLTVILKTPRADALRPIADIDRTPRTFWPN